MCQLCEAAGGEAAGGGTDGGDRDAESKTRTPHKDVGNNMYPLAIKHGKGQSIIYGLV